MLLEVRFMKVKYDNKKEKQRHMVKMLSDGWRIEWEDQLYISWKKGFTFEDRCEEVADANVLTPEFTITLK